MTDQGHFTNGYWALLRKIEANSPLGCEKYPDLFFPEEYPTPTARRVATAYAKRLCNACPIKADCLSYALESNQRYGIWGGTSPSER